MVDGTFEAIIILGVIELDAGKRNDNWPDDWLELCVHPREGGISDWLFMPEDDPNPKGGANEVLAGVTLNHPIGESNKQDDDPNIGGAVSDWFLMLENDPNFKGGPNEVLAGVTLSSMQPDETGVPSTQPGEPVLNPGEGIVAGIAFDTVLPQKWQLDVEAIIELGEEF